MTDPNLPLSGLTGTEAEATAHYNTGMEARKNKDISTAYSAFAAALKLQPRVPAYHLGMALTASELARRADPLREQAIIHAKESALLNPTALGSWLALAEIALANNAFTLAISAYEQVIEMAPNEAKYHTLIGFAHSKNNEHKEAMKYYARAVELDPELGDTHFLLSCMYMNDHHNAAKQAYHGERGFLSKKPARLSIESCWNAAHGFLGLGEYAKGWKYFECRLKRNITNTGQQLLMERFKQYIWQGERDKTVIVTSEMGLGDVFLFARFFPRMLGYGVKIIFESHEQMLNLMQHSFPDILCIPYGSQADGFDFHLPMMSLPHATRAGTAEWHGPYIKAEPAKVDEWRARLPLSPNQPNVGICWSAGKRNWNAENNATFKRKSVPFENIEPLLQTPGVNFISLQVDQCDKFPHPGIKNFSDTAAIIEQLDLVIACDSSVANLAGAMGKPVWIMDRIDNCWRYRTNDWFPNTRVFRQTASGDWKPVIDAIMGELKEFKTKTAA